MGYKGPIQRMWINQPSTLQPLHDYHGINVLAQEEMSGSFTVYFLSGPIISMRVPRNAISYGWKENLK